MQLGVETNWQPGDCTEAHRRARILRAVFTKALIFAIEEGNKIMNQHSSLVCSPQFLFDVTDDQKRHMDVSCVAALDGLLPNSKKIIQRLLWVHRGVDPPTLICRFFCDPIGRTLDFAETHPDEPELTTAFEVYDRDPALVYKQLYALRECFIRFQMHFAYDLLSTETTSNKNVPAGTIPPYKRKPLRSR